MRALSSRAQAGLACAALVAACTSDPGTATDGASTTTGEGSTGDPTHADDTASTSSSSGASSGEEPEPACMGGDPEAWLDAPLHAQLAALATGEVCCDPLRAAHVARIEAVDPRTTNSVITLDAAAAAQAQALDQAAPSLPLHCALVLVKDNVDVAGLATTAGSLAMAENVVDEDATAVARLREAGAVVLGKTNLSEWANFRGYGSNSGWSSLGGQTNNGADPAYNPCGSSSGSAAAVAAGLVAAALGTETNGSIVCPASVNGVVGLKPTLGLVSRAGVIPIAHSHDVVGPITATVRDAALLLTALAGPDPADPSTAETPEGLDFTSGLDTATLAGKRFGTDPAHVALLSAEVQDLYALQLERLAAAGAEIVEVQLPDTSALGTPFFRVLLHEFKAGLNDYLAQHAAPGVPPSLAEIIAFNAANAEVVMPHFGQEIFELAEMTTGLDSPTYLSSLDFVREASGPQGLLLVLDEAALDAIVLPTQDVAWTTDYESGDPFIVPTSTLPAAAGYPHLTVPMGDVEGLPVGLSFIGRAGDDRALLEHGHAFEQLD